MSKPSQSPTHLLRALLREASYLPDATARQYFARHIVNRFRAYQPQANATTSLRADAIDRRRNGAFRRRPAAIIQRRTAPLLRKAHKALNYLRRANQGEMACLQKVLYFAYGRLGRRRYALLEALLRPDSAISHDASAVAAAPLQQLYYSNKRYLQFFDPPKPVSRPTRSSQSPAAMPPSAKSSGPSTKTADQCTAISRAPPSKAPSTTSGNDPCPSSAPATMSAAGTPTQCRVCFRPYPPTNGTLCML